MKTRRHALPLPCRLTQSNKHKTSKQTKAQCIPQSQTRADWLRRVYNYRKRLERGNARKLPQNARKKRGKRPQRKSNNTQNAWNALNALRIRTTRNSSALQSSSHQCRGQRNACTQMCVCVLCIVVYICKSELTIMCIIYIYIHICISYVCVAGFVHVCTCTCACARVYNVRACANNVHMRLACIHDVQCVYVWVRVYMCRCVAS